MLKLHGKGRRRTRPYRSTVYSCRLKGHWPLPGTYECRSCRKQGTPYMEKHRFPIRRFYIALHLHPQRHGRSVRSLNWESHYTTRKKNGMPWDWSWAERPCQTGSSCLSGQAFPCDPPSETGTAETGLPAYRWDPCTGAERTGEKEYIGFLHVGLL